MGGRRGGPHPSSGGPPGLHFFWVWAPTFLIFIILLISFFFCRIFNCFYFLSFLDFCFENLTVFLFKKNSFFRVGEERGRGANKNPKLVSSLGGGNYHPPRTSNPPPLKPVSAAAWFRVSTSSRVWNSCSHCIFCRRPMQGSVPPFWVAPSPTGENLPWYRRLRPPRQFTQRVCPQSLRKKAAPKSGLSRRADTCDFVTGETRGALQSSTCNCGPKLTWQYSCDSQTPTVDV